MLFKTLALAATATALVVPEISEADEGVFRALPINTEPFEIPPTALVQTLEVPCLSCRAQDAHLKMDFAIEDDKKLLANGLEIYPRSDPFHGELTAAVVDTDGLENELGLGYALFVAEDSRDEEQQMEVVNLGLSVFQVDRQFEDVVPINIKLIKVPTGEILIGSIELEPSTQPSNPKCDSILCRFTKWFKGHKGCGGMRNKGAGGHDIDDNKVDDGGHHKHTAHTFSLRRLLVDIFEQVLWPFLLGYASGICVVMCVPSLYSVTMSRITLTYF